MKHLTKLFRATIAIAMMLCVALPTFAYDFEVNGIYYNYLDETAKTVAVTYKGSPYDSYTNEYTGAVSIPSSVTYNSTTYSVTSIGYRAFTYCDGLTSVTIPNSVTSIGDYVFDDCSGLTELIIEDGKEILSLGCNYFYNSSYTGQGLFYDCPLEKLYLGRNLNYDSSKMYGYSPFYSITKLKEITIGNSVTSIGYRAFAYCDGLTSVTIPNSVTEIGDYAFYYCDGLTSVTIPNSVTEIGYSAFYNCTGLTEVNFNAENCTSMGSYDYPVFEGCANLKTLNIGNSVKTIPNSAFRGCDGLTEVTIPNSVTSIGGSAFSNCSGLTSITIPNSVTTIGYSAFDGCTGLTELIIEDGKETLSLGYNYNSNSSYSTGEGLFYDCPLEKLYLGRNLNYDSRSNYGYSPFYSKNIKSVTFGSAILSIDKNLMSTTIKTIWLTNTPPSGYEYAQGVVNYVSNDLYTELIDKTVYPYLSSMFEVDGVMYVPVSPSERTCDALDCTYENDIDSINIGKTVSYKGIAMNVKNINHYTFYRNNYLTDLTIDSLFAGTIGNHAVWGCKNLKGIDIPNLVTEVGANCFEQCDSLKFAIIGNSVPAINDNTFAGCYSLTDITIPKNVASVGNYAFDGCKAMTNVFIADRNTILELGSNGNEPMFSDCPLDSVYIGGNISYSYADSCGYSPFYRNTSLRAVKITDKETEISDNEFYGCTNLKYVSIGNGVELIGNWAFSGCSSLDYFAFGTSMKTIGEEAFSDCTAVTKLYSQASTPPVCGTQALDDINKWTCELYVPGESIPAYQAADQWKEFFFMYDGVEGVEMDNNAVEVARYDIHGRLLSKPARGFNIVIYSDGTTRKEIVKLKK